MRQIQTLGEAFTAFMERKTNLRPHSQDNYRWIVGSFVRHAGVDLAVESLTWRHIQRWLDSTYTNDQGRYSYWQRAGIFCRFLVSRGLLIILQRRPVASDEAENELTELVRAFQEKVMDAFL